jgi:hypothetical protein
MSYDDWADEVNKILKTKGFNGDFNHNMWRFLFDENESPEYAVEFMMD